MNTQFKSLASSLPTTTSGLSYPKSAEEAKAVLAHLVSRIASERVGGLSARESNNMVLFVSGQEITDAGFHSQWVCRLLKGAPGVSSKTSGRTNLYGMSLGSARNITGK